MLVLFATPDRDGVTKAAASTSPGSLPVAVLSVKPWAGAMAVPRSYFGLSTEYWALPIYERRLALFDRVLALLHVHGDGPLVLRTSSMDEARERIVRNEALFRKVNEAIERGRWPGRKMPRRPFAASVAVWAAAI